MDKKIRHYNQSLLVEPKPAQTESYPYPSGLGSIVNDLLSKKRAKKIYDQKYYLKNRKKIVRRHKLRYSNLVVKPKIRSININRDYKLYVTYNGMITRCYNKKHKKYKYYGGKGIKVEWPTYKDFKNDMYGSYLAHLAIYGRKDTTIDRINSNGNYSKQNCRWATWAEQHKSRAHKTL